MTEQPSPPEKRTRRRWPWVVGAIAVVGVAATVVVLSLDGDATPDPDASAASVNTSEVVRTDLIAQETYDGTLGTIEDDPLTAAGPGVVSFAPEAGDTIGFGEVLFAVDGDPVVLLNGDLPAYRDFRLGEDLRTINSRVSGTLTSVVEVGTILEQGDVIATVDGQPVVALFGSTPAYRRLFDASTDLTGTDVAQLEQALVDLGYDPDGTVTVDDEFTYNSGQMVERWQEEVGMEVDGVVDLGEVVFIQAAAQVTATFGTPGDRVSDGSGLIAVSAGNPLTGSDVFQLEQALVSLGFDAAGQLTADGTFDEVTAAAIRELQDSLGADADGFLAASEVRFASAPVRVSGVTAPTGTSVGVGAPVLSLSSTNKLVTMDLPAADQGLLEVGEAVEVELPDGTEVPATVTSVADTATGPGGGGAVFAIEITLDDPDTGAGYEQAPVDVIVTSDSVFDVIAVPVSALLALAEGGYAVEVVQADDTTRLVGVETGFYAGGLVEITSSGIQPGDLVVVP